MVADRQTGVVYALGCTGCPKVYIGETGRTARQRVKEPQDHAKKGNFETSASAHPVLATGHTMHWKPRIVNKDRITPDGKCMKRSSFRN